jgi:hypothetical protein
MTVRGREGDAGTVGRISKVHGVRVKLKVVMACPEDGWRRLAPAVCSAVDEEDGGELASGRSLRRRLMDAAGQEVISDWWLQLVAEDSSSASGVVERGAESRGGHCGEGRSRDDASRRNAKGRALLCHALAF